MLNISVNQLFNGLNVSEGNSVHYFSFFLNQALFNSFVTMCDILCIMNLSLLVYKKLKGFVMLCISFILLLYFII